MIRKVLFLLYMISSMSFAYAQSKKALPFIWRNDTLNGEAFQKTSMHIPVHFIDDTTTYYFQFDTGSNKSFLYTRGTVDSNFVKRLTAEMGIESDIGKLHLLKRSSNRIYTKNGKVNIGTIGADFLADKKIEIDFPNQIIQILDSYQLADYQILSIKTNRGRPKISMQVQKKRYDFLFDTGSSLFELWTTEKLWKQWRDPKSSIQEFPISSWGKINPAYRSHINREIISPIFSDIYIETIWYNSNKSFNKSIRQIHVAGIIGNKPFLHHILLIDIANKRMGIKH